MPSRRIERVNELLLREISSYVMENQPPDMGFVTFTGVSVTDDLMQAKVFYSVLGTGEERSRTAQVFENLKPELTRNMRRLESLKRIPEFQFVYDETPAKAARVSEILEKIHQQDGPPSSLPLPSAGATPPSEKAKNPRAKP